jgi:hypothetical protein
MVKWSAELSKEIPIRTSQTEHHSLCEVDTVCESKEKKRNLRRDEKQR